MDYVKAVIFKFVMITVVLYLVLSLIYGALFVNVLWTSVALTFWSYLLGDLVLLPYAGNRVALVADFGIAFLCIWIMGVYTFSPSVPLLPSVLLATLVITIAEGFFHTYMRRQIMDVPERQKA